MADDKKMVPVQVRPWTLAEQQQIEDMGNEIYQTLNRLCTGPRHACDVLALALCGILISVGRGRELDDGELEDLLKHFCSMVLHHSRQNRPEKMN